MGLLYPEKFADYEVNNYLLKDCNSVMVKDSIVKYAILNSGKLTVPK